MLEFNLGSGSCHIPLTFNKGTFESMDFPNFPQVGEAVQTRRSCWGGFCLPPPGFQEPAHLRRDSMLRSFSC